MMVTYLHIVCQHAVYHTLELIMIFEK